MSSSSTIHTLLRRTRTALKYGREHGLGPLVGLTRQKLRSQRGNLLGKNRLIDFYNFVQQRQIGQPIAPGDVARTTINWVVPPFGFGSGGHTTIFRFVSYLEQEGFTCRIIVDGAPRPVSAEQARKQINDWFFPLKADVYIGIDAAPPAHYTFATGWQTAYSVRNFTATIHKLYFVQDFEPAFYAAGSEYVWAEETYRFGFIGLTAGTWLKEKLAREYNMRSQSFHFSFDHDLYTARPRPPSDQRRIFFYARPPTQRRAFELGLLVLNEVVRARPNVQVIFAGWDVAGYHIPFNHINARVVAHKDLPAVYNQCDVALVLSLTNLSLLPLELMACGTPVVSNRAPCTEWLLNDHNARLAAPTVESLSEALCAVLDDPAEASRLRAGGLATAEGTDWRVEARKIADFLHRLDQQEPQP